MTYKVGRKIAFLVLITLLVTVYLTYLVLTPECENEFFYTAQSEDGKYAAWLYSRTCGATTEFNTQISIGKVDAGFPDGIGNVFVSDANPQENTVSFKWHDSGLVINLVNHKSKVFKSKTNLGLDEEIDILYMEAK